MKQNKQEQIKDEWLDKLDAEIMWWFYDQIDLLFNATVVIDSTEIRNILKKAQKQIISQTRQEAVEDVLEEVIKYLEKMEIVLTPEQSGKHNYDQIENEYFKGRNMGILRCIDLLKSLSQEKK